jgi:transcriptional regulator with XRE-family HTH domain
LQSLLQRVRKATSERGERVKLADDLRVTRQRINDWLSGRMSPGGEITLRLLAWVTANEDKNKSAPGSGRNTARSKTRSTPSSYEKRKTGPAKS